jgi:hypothetical protein
MIASMMVISAKRVFSLWLMVTPTAPFFSARLSLLRASK